MNAEVIASGENGFLAATEGDWVRSIGALLENSDLRTRFGKASRQLVERNYSAERFAECYVDLMRRVAGR
jgi:glycosyltransferase involved in cell wall biosynthesis